MGTTVAVVAQGGTTKDVRKYAKSAREQKKLLKRQIRVSQKKVRKEKRGAKVWRAILKCVRWLIVLAQLVGSVMIVTALFQTEVLSVWQNVLVIMGLTLLLFINVWTLL